MAYVPAEGEACVKLRDAYLDAVSFLDKLDEIDDQITGFVQGFGRKCGTLGSVETLLETQIDEFKKPFEDGMKAVTEAAASIRTQINNVISTIEYVYTAGVNALKDAVTPILNVIDEAFAFIDSALTYFEDALLAAADVVNNALCSTLRGVIQGLPAEIVAGSAVLAAKQGILNEVTDFDARKVAKAALEKYAIRDKLDELKSKIDPLSSIPALPNIQEYICDPTATPSP